MEQTELIAMVYFTSLSVFVSDLAEQRLMLDQSFMHHYLSGVELEQLDTTVTSAFQPLAQGTTVHSERGHNRRLSKPCW